ncbi:MAG: hypothetical protein QOD75_4032 [Blastocatellia bacterium]|jgi:hypothetical protein|nr:hypothetical protein [Blastocatellia bacterium]
MRNKLVFVVAILMNCFLISTAFGQTASELEGKYGKPIMAYPVSENIWMTPEFTEDGQICYARLYPKRISFDTNYLGNEMQLWELKDVLDQLAPPPTRGKKTNFFGGSFLLGQLAETRFWYDKVTFTFLSSLKKASPTKKELEPTLKADDIFSDPFVPGTDIVIVSWRDRKCVNR